MKMLPKAILVSILGVAASSGLVGQTAFAEAADSTAPSAANPTRPHIVTIGDSIMAGYGLASPDQAWPALEAADEHVDVTNLACSGAGFVRVGDCGTDFNGLVGQAVAAHPDLVVIQASDNDQGQSAAAIARGAWRTVARIHGALPDARIVGLSTLWNQPGPADPVVAESSDALQAAVTAAGGTFVDVGQPLAGQPQLLQGDSEHPTVEGQRVLGDAIADDLAAAGISN
ncbi:lipolytic protein G-D-S-L family [Curtobacterium sp. MCBD17_034]|uniref:SGNH/GDSL hydrolase family protein n=1 Tax=unclassified Curtobacterium TaxID=257496 RepID=UPI000DA765BE|nr:MULTISPECIES: SGNH/GDSL hydrolase family protein [unclassified Curtobacterium]PZF62291.1 lipolytic protein G-D-S-L family [Curtobacterium sp. MCBD17_034]PZM40002.1 lipolytic protein G-D-S-L family [Curtobacterium sp. MCBD17_031]